MSAVKRGFRSTFSSLSVRNFRLFFTSQVISVTGTWMQMVAQAWLVLSITGSAAALGVVTACQFLPTLLVGPYAGVVADRFDKRRLLIATQVASMTLALTLGVLAATDVAQLWMVVGLAVALGLVSAFDSPARQSFVLEMVGPSKLTNALSLNTITINVGRLFGPAVAGIVIARWDVSVCFIVNGFSYIAPIIALAIMRPAELLRTPRAVRAKGQLREGLRYVWSRPALLIPLSLMVVIGTLTYEYTVTLPILAKDTFAVGAGGFGLMQSAMSVGAIIGGLVIATRTKPTVTHVGWSAAGFGAIMLVLAVTPTFGSALVILPLVGAGSTLFMTLVNSVLQLNSAPEMRSRVMSLFSVALVGSTPIGGPIVGWITETYGVRWALVLGGAAAVGGAAVTMLLLRRQRAEAAATVVAVALSPSDFEIEAELAVA